MLMITPLSCSRITGSTCFEVRNTLFRFTSMIRCQFSSLRCVGPASPMPIPTLLCRMSIRPSCDRPASTIATQSTCAASASNHDAVPPSPAIIDCGCRAASRSRSTSSTLAPSRANRIAVARPFPIVSPGVCPAPTMIATFPSSLTAQPPFRRGEASTNTGTPTRLPIASLPAKDPAAQMPRPGRSASPLTILVLIALQHHHVLLLTALLHPDRPHVPEPRLFVAADCARIVRARRYNRSGDPRAREDMLLHEAPEDSRPGTGAARSVLTDEQ